MGRINHESNIKKIMPNGKSTVIDQLFIKARSLHQGGMLSEAYRLYDSVLKASPNHFDALHLQGLIKLQLGAIYDGAELISKALKILPNHPDALNNLGNALREIQQPQAAIDCYSKAIKSQPSAAIYCNRGITHMGQGSLDMAISDFASAIKLDPSFAESYHQLGNALKFSGNHQFALENYDHAIKLQPKHASAYCNRGVLLAQMGHFDLAIASLNMAVEYDPHNIIAYSSLGNILNTLGKTQDAITNLKKALEIAPNSAEILCNLGHVYCSSKQYSLAFECFDQAIKLKPNLEVAYNNRGNAFLDNQDYQSAINDFKKAIQLNPVFAAGYRNLGVVYNNLKEFSESIDAFHHAINLEPDNPSAHYHLGLTLLSTGQLEKGWQEFEWRWLEPSFPSQQLKLNRPKWHPSFSQQTILIWPEQGLGDQIFYAGMLNDLIKTNNNIILAIDQRLHSLMQRSFPSIKTISPDINEINNVYFDSHLSIGSLGQYYRNNFPAEVMRNAYLIPDPLLCNELKNQLVSPKKLICGITWSSNNADLSANKGIQLNELLPILSLPDIKLVDLQYSDTTHERADLLLKNHIEVAKVQTIDNFNHLDALSALISACDAIVTISNTTAHIAAALGKPVFLMVPKTRGLLWYWHHDLTESPWYPNVRIFRQSAEGNWQDVVNQVANAVHELCMPAKKPDQSVTYKKLKIKIFHGGKSS